jgi:hypothetical protein
MDDGFVNFKNIFIYSYFKVAQARERPGGSNEIRKCI